MENRKRDTLNDVLISPDLIALGLEAASDQEAITALSRLLYQRGLVKDSYAEAVCMREERYPTGLQFEKMGVALPHTDAIHVNRQAIAIGILDRPVAFCAMGMPEKTVEVSLIFMLAVSKPEKEAVFLSNLIDIFQNPDNLEAIRCAVTEEEAAQKFRHMFGNESI